jgi:hypothetical protein
MSDKYAAFLRLSEKRLETIEDAVRIWSNLSGPSYEFTAVEVMAGVDRIRGAAIKALERFRDTRQWRLQAGTEEYAGETQEDPEEPAAPELEASSASDGGITARQAEMLRIWDEASNETGMLLEMLAMQREVIAHLQAKIDGKAA